jgi:hypothetical protein
MAVPSGNFTKPIHVICGQNAEFLKLQQAVEILYLCLYFSGITHCIIFTIRMRISAVHVMLSHEGITGVARRRPVAYQTYEQPGRNVSVGLMIV